jgi:hypothetical protein
MKDVYELLRQKELEISRLETEVEALRVVAPLLSENQDVNHDDPPTATSSTTPSQPTRVPSQKLALAVPTNSLV